MGAAAGSVIIVMPHARSGQNGSAREICSVMSPCRGDSIDSTWKCEEGLTCNSPRLAYSTSFLLPRMENSCQPLKYLLESKVGIRLASLLHLSRGAPSVLHP